MAQGAAKFLRAASLPVVHRRVPLQDCRRCMQVTLVLLEREDDAGAASANASLHKHEITWCARSQAQRQ